MNRDPKVKTTGSSYLVSNSDQVQSTITKVVEDFGKIDVFVANAGTLTQPHDLCLRSQNMIGMAISKPILEQTLDEYKKQMSVNGTRHESTIHYHC